MLNRKVLKWEIFGSVGGETEEEYGFMNKTFGPSSTAQTIQTYSAQDVEQIY
jgi:hypothetical protein